MPIIHKEVKRRRAFRGNENPYIHNAVAEYSL